MITQCCLCGKLTSNSYSQGICADCQIGKITIRLGVLQNGNRKKMGYAQ